MRDVFFLIPILAACGPSPSPAPSGDPAVVLGTGGSSFAELRDGMALPVVRGTQGGLHFDVAVRVDGVPAIEGARLSYEIHDISTGERIDRGGTYALRESRLIQVDGSWLRLGDRAILETVEPGDVVGRTVELKAILRLGEDVLEDRCDIEVADAS